ncbi:hypothetical protein SCHPADRAFT_903708 [Schizopora paradoxa]|uniref:Uncharacterized protein n=1 Tax=Schizopora paradoxa TaxID=27342 RepID=A0A0H2RPT0_9AGAM|nr:hypothetical protein SCHPADRAFT_903708 [Schizopora paradoxa]
MSSEAVARWNAIPLNRDEISTNDAGGSHSGIGSLKVLSFGSLSPPSSRNYHMPSSPPSPSFVSPAS